MLECYKNRPSVAIWSLGNNLGDGGHVDKCADILRESDARPIFYSGADGAERSDFDSTGEPSQKPCIIPDYSTGINALWGKIYKEDGLAGAFFADWATQAVSIGDKYYTKGDLNSSYKGKDGGLVSYDGKYSPMLAELKYSAPPVSVEVEDIRRGMFTVTNLYDFIYLSRLDCSYELTCGGRVVNKGSVGVLPIPPRRSQTVYLELDPPSEGRCFVRMVFRQLGQSLWADAGEPVAHFQFELPVESGEVRKELEAAPVTTQQSRSEITITGDNFEYSFDKKNGTFSRMNVMGAELLAAPMQHDISTNADIDSAADNSLNLKGAYPRVYDVSCQSIGDGTAIGVKLALCVDGVPPVAYVDAEYIINPAGDIKASFDVNIADGISSLPGFGIMLSMDKLFDDVTYFGMGPMECRASQKAAAYKSLFKSTADGMTSEFSQDLGWRYATEWAALQSPDGHGLISKGEFIFAVKADLAEAGAGHTKIYTGCISQSGSTKITEKNFKFNILLRPIAAGESSLEELAYTRYDWDEGYV